jgi:hypothetical protein
MKRLLNPMLALGVVSVLALSAATPSLGQTQRQRDQGYSRDQGMNQGYRDQDETFGQAPPRDQAAPRERSRAATGQQCWIPTNADLDYGYWGDCSAKGSRPVK